MRSIVGQAVSAGALFSLLFLLLPGVIFAQCVTAADCGVCQDCQAGVCVTVAAGTPCAGTTDCSMFGWVCQPYPDVSKVCNAAGACVDGTCVATNAPSSVTLASYGLPCAHCDGAGGWVFFPAGETSPCTDSTDCDYLDSTCRDYADVGGQCDGGFYCVAGNCASSYTDLPTSTACTTDCDYLDTDCRNYDDMIGTCDGAGACSAASCTTYADVSAGTSCASSTNCDYLDTACRNYFDVNSTCDGSGSCIGGSCIGAYVNEPASTPCPGSIDCDYLDTACRDYSDVGNLCDGFGGCGPGDCSGSYSDMPLLTSCGTGVRVCATGNNPTCDPDRMWADTPPDTTCTQTCDGSGSCDPNSCTSAACARTKQGTDSDGDGYDAQCNDCNDSNWRITPVSANPFCKCPQTGISELTNCVLDGSGRHFQATPLCRCLDGIDNDCDGDVDMADSDCPDLSQDWIIQAPVTLSANRTMNASVYVWNGGSLTISPGVTLTIRRPKILKVLPGGYVDPESLGRITYL